MSAEAQTTARPIIYPVLVAAKVGPELARRLQAAAAFAGVPRSQFLRRVLEQGLAAEMRDAVGALSQTKTAAVTPPAPAVEEIADHE